jgi:hypothetical protein
MLDTLPTLTSPAPVAAPDLLGPDRGIFVAAPAALIRWAQRAIAGETCTYARVSRMPRTDACAAAARMLSDGGSVQLWQARSSLPGLFEYRARRTLKPLVTMVRPLELPRAQRLVLQILTEAAEEGQPCPTNSEIALQAGLGYRQRAAAIVVQLRNMGLIKVDSMRAPIGRRVTICDTGATTSAKASIFL